MPFISKTLLLLLLPLLCVAPLLACDGDGDGDGDGDADPCSDGPGLEIVLSTGDDPLPAGTTTTTVTLTFDQDVEGVAAGDTVTVTNGAVVVGIEGGPASFEVTVTGLASGESHELRVAPEGDEESIASVECEQPLAEAVTAEIAVEAGDWSWMHDGEIDTDDPVWPREPYFREVSDESGLTDIPTGSLRAMAVDIDGDGWDDLVTLNSVAVDNPETLDPVRVARALGPDRDGIPQFEEFTDESGLADASANIMVFGDVDNDGDQDAFAGLSRFWSRETPTIWLNDGDGHFTAMGDVGIEAVFLEEYAGEDIALEQSAAGFADFDGDGNLDLYVGHFYSIGSASGGWFTPAADHLYRGDGTGHFTFVELPDQHNPLTSEVAPTLSDAARAAYGLSMADYDNDGDMDVFVNNYGAGRPAMDSPPRYWDHNLLWRNDTTEPGEIVFVDVGVEAEVAATMRGNYENQRELSLSMDGTVYPSPIGGNGFGSHFGDFDNDGDMDLIVGTIAHPDYSQSDRTMLHVNEGGPDWEFGEESLERGLEYYEDELHPFFIDVNNDGRLDLPVSRLRGGSKWEFYWQNEDQNFDMQTYAATGVDIERPGPSIWFDADGDGDLDFFMPKGTGRLFLNDVGQDNNWLTLDLRGTAPRDATGARVTLTSDVGIQMREVTSGNGHYNTQFSRLVVFGLGGDSGAADVTIRWPDGEIQRLGDVTANTMLRVTQGEGVEEL